MKGKSHSAMSGLTFLIAGTLLPSAAAAPAWLTPPPESAPLLAWGWLIAGASVASVAGLLPDIDHPQATLAQWTVARLGPWRVRPLLPLSLLASRVGHRKGTHSLYATLLVGFLAALWSILLGGLAWAVLWGYATHILCDMMTHSGVDVLWPHDERNYHLLPRPLRFSTGSVAERLIVAMTTLLVGGWLGLVVWLRYGGV